MNLNPLASLLARMKLESPENYKKLKAMLRGKKKKVKRKGTPQAKGGFARAEALTPERRKEIAKKAANTRWGKR